MSKDIKNFITWIRTFLDDVYANTIHTHSTTEVADPNAHSDIGTSADATQSTINTAINTSISNKAPKSHSSTASTYGLGTTIYYGHCKIRNNLTDSTYSNGYVLSSYQGYLLNESINTKQDILVSGTNIKTINNESILGSGNIVIGGTGTIDDTVTQNSSNPVKSSGIFSALAKKQNNLQEIYSAININGLSIFDDDGALFSGINNRIYYDYADTNELHFINSNEDDINFDDIIIEGDSRLTNARTPTAHNHSIPDVTNLQTTLNDKLEESDLLDLIYPVGSIYMSVNDVNPASLFGGTWEQIKDKFLLSKGDTYSTNGATGGEATHTLSIDEMPSHNHRVSSGWQSASGTDRITFGQVNGQYQWNGVGGVAFIEARGGGQAHNNMPPYLVVNVWKRTA